MNTEMNRENATCQQLQAIIYQIIVMSIAGRIQ